MFLALARAFLYTVLGVVHRLFKTGHVAEFRTDLHASFVKYFRSREIAKVMAISHAQELTQYSRNEWPQVMTRHAAEIAAALEGKFPVINRRSWSYPWLPESLHRLNVPILKNTPFNLRRFSETPIPRRAINLVKNTVVDLPWKLVPEEDIEHDEEVEQRIRIGRYCLNHPNDDDSFRTLTEQITEDILVGGYGAAEFGMTPDYRRPFKLWAVDGSTIRIYADWMEGQDDRPRYAQMTGLRGERGLVQFLDDELIYIRDNIRTSTPFGLGRVEVAFNCYSADTDVLTKRGWLPWPEVKITDKFATRNPITGAFEWQSPTKLHKAKHSGSMIHFHGISSDFLVTPNHRMFGQQQISKNGWSVPKFLPAEQVARLPKFNRTSYPFRVPSTSEWQGKLPASGRIITVAGQRVLLEDWIAFLGIYLAEGCASGSMNGITKRTSASPVPHYVQAMNFSAVPTAKNRQYHVAITQKSSGAHFQDIWKLFKRLPWKFSFHSTGFYIVNKDLHAEMLPLGNKYTKRVPDWVKDLPKEYLEVLLDWAIKGDGHVWHRSDKGWAAVRMYATVSKQLADDFQELFQKIGKVAGIGIVYPKRKATRIAGRLIDHKRCAPQYWLVERNREFTTLGQADFVDYTGSVYCASVPNETLYIRRNGKPLWCGNTINAFLGVQDMSSKAGADQVHKTWLWWENTQADAHLQQVMRHLYHEDEGQAKVSVMSGLKKPEVIDVIPVSPEDLLLEWQEFLIRIIAAAFDLSPMSLGLERDVNRNTSETMATSDFRSAVVPVAHRMEEAYTRRIFHKVLGWTNIKFKFIGLEDPDILTKTQIQQRQYAMNAITPDEIREDLGRDPLPSGLGKLTQIEAMVLIQDITMQRQASAMGPQQQPYDEYGDPVPPQGGPGGQGGPAAGGGMLPKPKMMTAPTGNITGSAFTARQIAGMKPDQILRLQAIGMLPDDTNEMADSMEEQEPGILETLSEELQVFFDYAKQHKKEIQIKPAKVKPTNEKDQLERYTKFNRRNSRQKMNERAVKGIKESLTRREAVFDRRVK